VAERNSLREVESDVDLMIRLKDWLSMSLRSATLCFQVLMEVFISIGVGYTRATPTQSVPRFRLHCKSESGIVYCLLEIGTVDHRRVSIATLLFMAQ
jgi:hypothetical protein